MLIRAFRGFRGQPMQLVCGRELHTHMVPGNGSSADGAQPKAETASGFALPNEKVRV